MTLSSGDKHRSREARVAAGGPAWQGTSQPAASESRLARCIAARIGAGQLCYLLGGVGAWAGAGRGREEAGRKEEPYLLINNKERFPWDLVPVHYLYYETKRGIDEFPASGQSGQVLIILE
jgi:hypothetical protein